VDLIWAVTVETVLRNRQRRGGILCELVIETDRGVSVFAVHSLYWSQKLGYLILVSNLQRSASTNKRESYIGERIYLGSK
jgi:hypothetical protein